MPSPDPAVSAVRSAVRRFLASADAVPFAEAPLVVACSGGADSLALAAAVAHVAPRRVRALVVDHQLQAGSAEVAARAAEQVRRMGCEDVRVCRAEVRGPGGAEAAARRARYDVLSQESPDDALVLLGHTLDDQAETVLLGLGRGSGPRSIAGMRPLSPPWARPLLDTSRVTTRKACSALGLEPWDDPHNVDPTFTRARLRGEVVPLLEEVLQGGVAEALARTAAQLQDDSDALDALGSRLRGEAHVRDELDTEVLAAWPAAVRRRALREWLYARGVPELDDRHLRAADALVGRWRGQGPHALPGGFELRRAHGRLRVDDGGHACTAGATGG
ncbi:tRNA lysidine(34) synthetase TilS [Allosaccharopolyspora coralli]|uniref:tRNA lysidine(34) synthetase TilS n=1 Tax=Allosaccharopolyspora coralli TaxID=2665642 RepID=UPI001E2F74E2|nr:tRNA lysidine(34) synthetase TilS [Allosaccharopolyspora coralli]